MKNAIVQIASFLFVLLTPYVSFRAFPLYVLANLLLGPASIVLLLVSAEQVGSTLEFPRTGLVRRLFQVWYWINVVIAAPCMAVALYLFLFGLQRGDHIVVTRETVELHGRSGRIDLLIGQAKNSENPKRFQTLLAYIMYDPRRVYEEIDASVGDGRNDSVTNVRLNTKGSNTFSYGSFWDRTTEVVVIQDREFSRKDGNVFLILQTDSYPYDIIQLPGACHAIQFDEVIKFAKEQCEQMGESRLRQLRDTK
jgi:hypothetical protein